MPAKLRSKRSAAPDINQSSSNKRRRKQEILEPHQPETLAQLQQEYGFWNQRKENIERRSSSRVRSKQENPDLVNARNRVSEIEARIREIENASVRMEPSSSTSSSASSSSAEISTGMTSSHQETFVDFAKSNALVVIVRPINSEAAQRFGSNQNYTGKRLNTKGKSSEFGPIAGDIPYQAALSKLAKDNPSQISAYQKKNDEVLEADEITYQNTVLDVGNLQKVNDLFLVHAITKRDNGGREIYFLKDEHGEILREEGSTMPIFIVEHQGEWLRYSSAEKAFNIVYQTPEGFDPDNVRIMAYRHFELLDGQIRETYHPITADYDELVSASIKRIPFELNERIPTQFTQEVFNSFLGLLSENISSIAAKNKIMQGIAELIYKYEEQEKREHRDRTFLPQMGVVNAWELAGKTYLKHETAGATNHGPETNNPWPEPINPGNYIAYLPNGQIEVLKDEHAICEFINKWRKEGFPLDVNPKWGWDMDKDGNLFIPEHRLNWDKIREKLELLKMQLFSLKDAQIELLTRFGLKYSKHNIGLIAAPHYDPKGLEYLENYQGDKNELNKSIIAKIIKNESVINELSEKCELEAEIVNLKVTMEKLRLEPDIIYNFSPRFSPKINTMIENASIRSSIIKVSTNIREMDQQQRKSMFELYSVTFNNKQKEFIRKLKERSIIMEEVLLTQDQSELSKVQDNHTSFSSAMHFNKSY